MWPPSAHVWLWSSSARMNVSARSIRPGSSTLGCGITKLCESAWIAAVLRVERVEGAPGRRRVVGGGDGQPVLAGDGLGGGERVQQRVRRVERLQRAVGGEQARLLGDVGVVVERERVGVQRDGVEPV